MTVATKSICFRYGILFSVALFSHFLWESAHLSLYGGYANLSPVLPITLWASVGDALYVLGALLLVSLFQKDILTLKITPRELIGFALLGFCIALFVEYKAFVFGKWHYLPTMPVVPFFEVGLSPLLQMTLLLPFSVFVTKTMCRKWLHF